MKTIVICDDDARRVEQWVEALRRRSEIDGVYEVKGLGDGQLEPNVNELVKRRTDARQGGRMPEVRNDIDKASVLVVDYDLPKLTGFLTGESVAYLARCYSTCGVIVAMNQYKSQNPFDLTLRDHPESFADLNIGSKQLVNAGLWGRAWSKFRPWAWPIIPEAEKAFEARVAKVLHELDLPILERLGFTPQMVASIPAEAREFLWSTASVEKVTFRQFATQSDRGLKAKDVALTDEALARIAAARVSRWLECFVIPRQDILVDAPHLALRFPSLLNGNHDDPGTWNAISKAETAPETGLSDVLTTALFDPTWSSRPCWDWARVSADERIKEVKDPWSIEQSKFVFAEDLSSFIEAEVAREFVAAFESPFSRRAMANRESERIDAETREQLKDVDYRPEERFFL